MRRQRSTPRKSLARLIRRFLIWVYGPPLPLQDYDTEELAAELEARGWRVVGP